jgi:5'-3' exonuclease
LAEIGVENKEFFQQNSISPGTEFLYDLCLNLKGRILKELEQNWKHLKIFFSDCCVPGEG